ncbi:U11/U12 small nuclear ribonucleoprotein 59 kDa protein-like [Papaver somniferum]|uniref:U11/U12 small nuclear ribonucleoprotein 59 kDa protein-like n=1 Tax=Papaver somniferum TaxID=3469 RepID=UPI000E6F7292|nr:U11/U12 small nuclear ribonucleoprotein 59 kDa protein-like [Papaver somniferum]
MYGFFSSQTTQWQDKSAGVRLANKIQKCNRNEWWRKKKRKRVTEKLTKKSTNLEVQELLSVEAANSLLLNLKSQIEPLGIFSSQTSQWEEKSAAVRLANKIQKCIRNKRWRKKKRKRVAEKLTKERERFDQADQQADEWRAREIAKDIARRKEIAKVKANEERKKLESELEMVLIVQKLQGLRSIRIQKLKKQGHFLPDEDDKFLKRVRAAVEEEERHAAGAADIHAAKDAIATAEESRKAIQNVEPELKDDSHNTDGAVADEVTETEEDGSSAVAAEAKPEQKQLEAKGYAGTLQKLYHLSFVIITMAATLTWGTLLRSEEHGMHISDQAAVDYLGIGFNLLPHQMKYGDLTWWVQYEAVSFQNFDTGRIAFSYYTCRSKLTSHLNLVTASP